MDHLRAYTQHMQPHVTGVFLKFSLEEPAVPFGLKGTSISALLHQHWADSITFEVMTQDVQIANALHHSQP